MTAGLLRAGVAAEEVVGLLEAVEDGDGRPLIIVPLPSEPREGDRIRVTGMPRVHALRIVAWAPARGRWAVVGDAVDPGYSDDEEVRR